ncbi:hypothetical protein LX15_006379 [Streptoalloteichus tenebrarius]|uniref:Isoamylase n=1 Tax=Streptoalloteichus tenebrarius (strain ATCC 17920 / DSM 40477 / JCM 4838 / CBS 697.72 / NBRC 16177 / NCIMB 11028 / NRRL B-12390 / A12253. 1 / ISP 5477) TaxID=1933 RepID=A0ABT1I4E1_STRSD|nr:isoamylase [Streptoalloteichus tenebrarius]MCP2262637.1 hypothetical protein [Streptoalloteichus tenebrarius]BFF02458.1 isoamylase [Streptoalloteichus tenebrarius]
MIRKTQQRDGRVRITFVLPVDEPDGPVSVVGCFNDWTPGEHELRRRSNGTRSTTVVVDQGSRLRFRYLGPNGHWFDDEHADDRDGQDNLVLA